MRWTNYFLHPADNRYYVFTFKEEEHAKRFEQSLIYHDIPHERSELEFGVPRTHFNEALKQNHLLHADIRKPFIENKGLRWTMLIVTGAMLLLAIVGAFSSKAYGQQIESKFGWELAVQGRASVPFAFAGVEPHVITNDTLTSTWNPLLSQSFGVRINNRFKESWTLGTGIMWIRRNYMVEMNYSNDDSCKPLKGNGIDCIIKYNSTNNPFTKTGTYNQYKNLSSFLEFSNQDNQITPSESPYQNSSNGDSGKINSDEEYRKKNLDQL